VISLDDGRVWAFGSNNEGQLGNGTLGEARVPFEMSSPVDVMAIAVGSAHSVFVTADGAAWAVGANNFGQLGDGTNVRRMTAKKVLGLTGVVAVAAGHGHTLALKQDGTVWAWGHNQMGQLGNSILTPSFNAVPVAGVAGAVAIAAGNHHSLALLADGSVLAWGDNTQGQAGADAAQESWRPVRVVTGAIAVAAGSWHSIALRGDGTVIAWGSNVAGQIGDGRTGGKVLPTPVQGLADIFEIAAGGDRSMALRVDETVWAWGAPLLGDGTDAGSSVPRHVVGLPPIEAIATGTSHSLAIDTDGHVWAWGLAANGRLGIGGPDGSRNRPIKTSEAEFDWKVGMPVLSPAPGIYSSVVNVGLSCATPGAVIHYTTDGSEPTQDSLSGNTVTIGSNTTLKAKAFASEMPESHTVVGIYKIRAAQPTLSPSGSGHTAPVNVTMTTTTPEAEIRYTTDSSEPGALSTLYTAPIPVGTRTTFKARTFKAGMEESTTRSVTYSFNLGAVPSPAFSPAPGTYLDSVPVSIAAINGATIRYTIDGSDPDIFSTIYTGPIAVTATTTFKAKAFHIDYPTASGTINGPYEIKATAPVLSVPAGTYPVGQKLAVTAVAPEGSIYYTINGVDPTENDAVLPSGFQLTLLQGFTLKAAVFKAGVTRSDIRTAIYAVTGAVASQRVRAGGNSSFAFVPDGSLWAWGYNANGRLGNGNTTTQLVPVPATLGTVRAVASGGLHTIALKADKTVWAWGNNSQGQLGNGGAPGDSLAPVQVSGLTNIKSIAAGADHSLAVDESGNVFAWGSNSSGQLGSATPAMRTTPVVIGSLSGVTAVFAAGEFSFAIKSGDGSVSAWGANAFGQLGNNSTTPSATPVTVSGLTNVKALAAGSTYVLALKNDGTVWSWGSNSVGQLGRGTAESSLTPVQTRTLMGAIAIAAGDAHGIAARKDGTVWAWGSNGEGQLGVGSTPTVALSPLLVSGISGLVDVAAGLNHSLGVKADASVWSWGHGANGELGDGTNVSQDVPIRVADASLVWNVSTPMLSVPSGTYFAPQTVVVSTVTPEATIRYTTDGSIPLETDPTVPPGGVLVDRTLVLKIKAWKSGAAASNVTSGTYTMNLPAVLATPEGGVRDQPFAVVLSSSISATAIRYTTNPSAALGDFLPYSGPVSIDRTTTVRAYATKTGWTQSATTSFVYTMKVGLPALTPAGGNYASAQTVNVSTSTAGASIHYTIDGLEPSIYSTPVSGNTILIDRSLTLKVKAFRSDWADSDTAIQSYTITQGVAAAATFSPVAGSFNQPIDVALSSTTVGATIRYTLDGSVPDLRSPIYRRPFRIAGNTTVKARAFKADKAPSVVTTAAYVVTLSSVAQPTLSPASGSYSSAKWVTIACATADAQMRYTIDGSDPTVSAAPVPADLRVRVDRPLVLKVRAFKTGLADSPVRMGVYVVTGAIAAGDAHTLAVTADGSLWGWGYNGNGQLGIGPNSSTSVPIAVSSLSNVVAVAADQDHSFAVKEDGTLWAWGENPFGVLGNNSSTPTSVPVQIGLTGVASVATGRFHSLALTSAGNVWAWGSNAEGQLGNNSNTPSSIPIPVPGLSDVVAISAGVAHSVALKRDGTLWTWGDNVNGQLGVGSGLPGSKVPVEVTRLSGVAAVAARGNRTFAVQTQGTSKGVLYAFGENAFGSFGDGSEVSQFYPIRLRESVGGMAPGSAHSVTRVSSGTGSDEVSAAGFGTSGELGNGGFTSSTLPVVVTGLDAVIELAAGTLHSVAVRRDGSIATWGHGGEGRLGNDLLANSAVPVEVASLRLFDGAWLTGDADADGLVNGAELTLGTDPFNPDSNGDGVPDGIEAQSGGDPLDLDLDDDGLSNAIETQKGTDPHRADTDGDGVSDSADCYPLDGSRSICPTPSGTAPVITIEEPSAA
jgi:alpha-tubulin suppressor-like RCC1 family protein